MNMEQRLIAAGIAIMSIEERDTLLATVAKLSQQNRKQETVRHELVEQVTVLSLRAERAETALAAIKRFGAGDCAMQHILHLAGVEL